MSESIRIDSILPAIRSQLENVSDTASLDAQVLLAHVMRRSRTWVLSHPEAALDDEQKHSLEAALSSLMAGEPLPYVLGHWEFYGLDFTLTPAVLIPRPETELLVEQALQWLTAHPGSKWVVDVGTGSGCIAVALAVHAPGLRLLASDISPAALRVASGNARRHAVDSRIDFVLSDLLPAVGVSLDLLCANLPYIPSPELGTLKAARREPLLALDGGSDGLNLLQRLLGLAQDVLSEHALLLLEIGAYQGAAAARLAQTVFPRARVEILPDLAGNDRLLCIERVSLSI